jgi:hypothetical protein
MLSRMTTRHLSITLAASWASLVVCCLVFIYIALTAANTVLVSDKQERDHHVQEVRASTDTHYLQERAVSFIELGWFTSTLSMLLCRLALGALLVSMICSGITLVQVRRLRRQFNESKHLG